MKPLSWKQRIERAEVKGKFSQSAKDMAEQWPHCAVGEKVETEGLDPITTSDLIWAGNHNYLRDLGMAFTNAVNSDDVKRAKRIYKKIQKVEL